MSINDQVIDEDIKEYCIEIIEKFPNHVDLYRKGGGLSFLIKEVMKESDGTWVPKLISDSLKELIKNLS